MAGLARQVRVRFHGASGVLETLGAVGESLVDVAKRAEVKGIRACCGQQMQCVTCHVHLDGPAFERVAARTPATSTEHERLDMMRTLAPGRSRLACQVILAEGDQDVEVTVPTASARIRMSLNQPRPQVRKSWTAVPAAVTAGNRLEIRAAASAAAAAAEAPKAAEEERLAQQRERKLAPPPGAREKSCSGGGGDSCSSGGGGACSSGRPRAPTPTERPRAPTPAEEPLRASRAESLAGAPVPEEAWRREDYNSYLTRRTQELEELKLALETRREMMDQAKDRKQANGGGEAKEDKDELRKELESLRITKASGVRLPDVVGLEAAKRLVHEAVVWPSQNAALFTGLRAPPRGVLLHGPPGCGKTLLAKAVANEVIAAGGSFFNVPAGTVMAKFYGESQKRIEALSALVADHSPAVVFFDEVDSLLGRRDDGQVAEHHRATTNALLAWMDGFDGTGQQVFFLAATNLRSRLDAAALRRFHASVEVPLPGAEQREVVIANLLARAREHGQRVGSDVSAADAAARTEGLSFDAITKAVQHAFLAPIRELPPEAVATATAATLRPVTWADLDATLPVETGRPRSAGARRRRA